MKKMIAINIANGMMTQGKMITKRFDLQLELSKETKMLINEFEYAGLNCIFLFGVHPLVKKFPEGRNIASMEQQIHLSRMCRG